LSIVIGSDLILDVIKSADPARQQRAAALLGAAGTAPATADFDAAPASAWPGLGLMEPAAAAPENPAGRAYRDFEAVFLRTALEAMLPASEGSLYGDGTSGNMWRSLAADQFSTALAKSGGIGIAAMLAAQQNPDTAAPAAAPPQAQAAWPYFHLPALGGLES